MKLKLVNIKGQVVFPRYNKQTGGLCADYEIRLTDGKKEYPIRVNYADLVESGIVEAEPK
jgi:hypothetical protein